MHNCRFCLEETADKDKDKDNPLIKPCKCKGSSAYVHKLCIKMWRRTTTEPLNVTNCQLCLAKFKLPYLRPLESIPDDFVDESMIFLSSPIFSFFVFFSSTYFFIMIFTFVFEYTMNKPHMFFSDKTHAHIYRLGHICSISTFTFLYSNAYTKHINAVNNKKLYFKKWFAIYYSPFCPFFQLFFVIWSLFLTIIFPDVVFSFAYICLTPKLFYTHRQLLLDINEEIF